MQLGAAGAPRISVTLPQNKSQCYHALHAATQEQAPHHFTANVALCRARTMIILRVIIVVVAVVVAFVVVVEIVDSGRNSRDCR